MPNPPPIPSNKGGRAYSGRGRQKKPVRVNPRNLKKTTKKGAYKPQVKKNFMKRRNPFVENKIRNAREFSLALDPVRDMNAFGAFADPTDWQKIPVDDAFSVILPSVFYSMNRGLNSNEMIGESIYAKYLKTKLQFLAPQGAYMIDYPCNLFLIHGWVTAPLNPTQYTTPTVSGMSYQNVFNHVTHYVKEYFNERKDTLEFPEKRERHIKFESYRKIKVNKNEDLPIHGYGGSAGTSTLGALAPINMSCKWEIMRKIHYDSGSNNPSLGNPATFPQADFNYPSTSFLPFICIFNPQFASTPGHPTPSDGHLWQVAHNSQMWYSDS